MLPPYSSRPSQRRGLPEIWDRLKRRDLVVVFSISGLLLLQVVIDISRQSAAYRHALSIDQSNRDALSKAPETTFPRGFLWGTATSSYQIEGAWNEGGKGPSIWDDFSHDPKNIKDRTNADVACDHYHHFDEDVALMKHLGMKAYRFSVSWSRVMPNGTLPANEEGIAFYNDLIDKLLDAGIEPWITLYHWDLPSGLHKVGGWTSKESPRWFADFARLCFERFGDRVARWITFNEPFVTAAIGYGIGWFAPGVVSLDAPYIVAHNLLLGHALAVDMYRREFKAKNKGLIGLTNSCDWMEPLTESLSDKEATERTREFLCGWFGDPIYTGAYPASMVAQLGKRLPTFTAPEQALLKGSNDFYGLNHYSTVLVSSPSATPWQWIIQQVTKYVLARPKGVVFADWEMCMTEDIDWELNAMNWNTSPWGLRNVLLWVHKRYNAPEIFITENGYPQAAKWGEPPAAISDKVRIDHVSQYIRECLVAIKMGVKLRGYFHWSLYDNFEWMEGYTKAFGLVAIDFQSPNKTRIPRDSAYWYSRIAEDNGFVRERPRLSYDWPLEISRPRASGTFIVNSGVKQVFLKYNAAYAILAILCGGAVVLGLVGLCRSPSIKKHET